MIFREAGALPTAEASIPAGRFQMSPLNFGETATRILHPEVTYLPAGCRLSAVTEPTTSTAMVAGLGEVVQFFDCPTRMAFLVNTDLDGLA